MVKTSEGGRLLLSSGGPFFHIGYAQIGRHFGGLFA
jgi:hypothetical protein